QCLDRAQDQVGRELGRERAPFEIVRAAADGLVDAKMRRGENLFPVQLRRVVVDVPRAAPTPAVLHPAVMATTDIGPWECGALVGGVRIRIAENGGQAVAGAVGESER